MGSWWLVGYSANFSHDPNDALILLFPHLTLNLWGAGTVCVSQCLAWYLAQGRCVINAAAVVQKAGTSELVKMHASGSTQLCVRVPCRPGFLLWDAKRWQAITAHLCTHSLHSAPA